MKKVFKTLTVSLVMICLAFSIAGCQGKGKQMGVAGNFMSAVIAKNQTNAGKYTTMMTEIFDPVDSTKLKSRVLKGNAQALYDKVVTNFLNQPPRSAAAGNPVIPGAENRVQLQNWRSLTVSGKVTEVYVDIYQILHPKTKDADAPAMSPNIKKHWGKITFKFNNNNPNNPLISEISAVYNY